MIGQTISHYKITDKLGEGGMGVVYKARDTKLERDVALKFLPESLTPTEEDKQRFIREAKAAAALSHPNICSIYSINEHDGQQFIEMEYIQGETLRAKIDSGDLTLQTALDYGSKIADALAEAHEQDIFHRDIKPENIMVDAKCRIKVMDFGLAKLKQSRDITKTGDTVGTLAYSSPEQIRGQRVDHRSDLFSLGIVLYEMLTGQRPFQGEHQAAMTYSIVNEEPAPLNTYLPDAPEGLDKLIAQMLAKKPENRLGSAVEAKEQLETIKEVTGEFSKQSPTAGADSEVAVRDTNSDSTTFRITVPNFGFGKKSLGKAGLLASVTVMLAVVVFVGWWFIGENAVEHNTAATPDDKKSDIANHSIAVLPFEVTGSGAEEWKDGMVTALSLNLDGAAGLRAIPDRTILAKWKQKGRADDIETQEALDIAREMGARYAIVGSAVQLGQDLRFGVDVREVASGERLGQVEVRGAPDSVTTLTNNLTKEILVVLLERSEGAIPSVDLGSITTESLPALKAFLQGERHFRSGEYQAAIGNYEAAIAMDSTFAMAYARLNPARYWGGKVEQAGKASLRAYEESDQLPRRERRITRARYLWYNLDHDMAAADSLRQLANEYPDDPSIWFLLGEVLWHGSIPRGWAEAEQAFQEAVQLDPGFTQYHHHLVDLAISFHHDSTLAAQRIADHPKGDYKQMYQLALDLAFGSAGQRRKALGRLDSIAPSTLAELIFTLWHPADGELEEKVIRKLIEEDIKSEFSNTRLLAENSLKRGKVQEMMSILQKEEMDQTDTNYYLALSLSLGYSIPDTLQRSYLKPTKIGIEASLTRFFLFGIYRITEGNDEDINVLMSRLRDKVGRAKGQDTLLVQKLINELQGYRAWKEEDTEQAEHFWSKSKLLRMPWNAIWRGDLYRKVDKLEKAEGWYVAAWRLPEAHERLGMLYEQMDKPEKAAEAYRRFITAWKDADPELQDRVEQARQRLEKLSVSEKGTTEEVVDVEE